ncbi:hypothetical protein B0H10DRAFT_1841381, partial [Mycena sp. CBHHK59/15]
YKKPLCDLSDNIIFNNYVLILCIRLEHVIGYLKGCFHTLKHLRVNICDEVTHKIATYWVSACAGIHAFAMQAEAEQQGGDAEGCFHTLKHLQVNICDEVTHKIATYWVSTCAGIHAFAMQAEAEQQGGDADSDDQDPFIAEGLSSTDRLQYQYPYCSG